MRMKWFLFEFEAKTKPTLPEVIKQFGFKTDEVNYTYGVVEARRGLYVISVTDEARKRMKLALR